MDFITECTQIAADVFGYGEEGYILATAKRSFKNSLLRGVKSNNCTLWARKPFIKET